MGVLCLDEETHGNKVPRVSGRRPHSRECLPRPPAAPGVVEALGGTGVACICFLGSGGGFTSAVSLRITMSASIFSFPQKAYIDIRTGIR